MSVSLIFVEKDKIFTIKEVSNKLLEKTSLVEKGFCSGNKIALKECNHENFIVDLNGSRYVLGFGLAKNIYVE